ncbi:MAG: HlyD family type I secretion periplasmic adaptor subunit [Pseudomonadota bacterium]
MNHENTHHATRQKTDRYVHLMGGLCLIGLGGFIGWAGFVPLEEGVSAAGSVVVESDRQVVQHLEGGIIQTISVQDGQFVEAGDTLLVLEETASLASRDQVSQRIAALKASVARLTSLQSGEGSVDFSTINNLDVSPRELTEIIARERDLFTQQRSNINAEIAVLRNRQASSQEAARLKHNEIEISERARASASEELRVARSMFEEKLVRKDKITQLERSMARYEGEIARLRTEQINAEADASDLAVQVTQRRAQFSEQIANDLRTAYSDLLSAEEQLFAAQDILNRAVVTAPVSGEVLNLAFSTEGGVVRPGEAILEIVPEIGAVTASVRIRPMDRASVYENQDVRVQISAYKSWLTPSVAGEIIDVSADLKTDIATGANYYEARVRVPEQALTDLSELEIIPGMPVDVFIYSGKSRTLADYLFEPISTSITKGLQTS